MGGTAALRSSKTMQFGKPGPSRGGTDDSASQRNLGQDNSSTGITNRVNLRQRNNKK